MAGSGGYGFGILGVGVIAEYHAKAIRAMQGGHLECMYEPAGGPRVERMAEAFDAKLYTGELDAFLMHPGLDVVTIATPSGAHLEACVAAAKAGKHIVCEKPLEVTLERADRMIAACREHHVRLGGIFQNRSAAAAQALKRAVTEGRFGQLTVCHAHVPWFRPQSYYDSGAWRGTWELDGGGALMNQSIHTVDLLQWLAGPVREVCAYAGNLMHRRIEVEDTAVAALKFRCGALGVLLGSTAMWPGSAMTLGVSGEKGTAVLCGADLVQWQFETEAPEDAELRERLRPKPESVAKGGAAEPRAISFEGHQRQFENFVRGLEGREKLQVDGTEARKALEIILAVYAAGFAGKPVRLPLKATPRRRRFPKL